jgi:hypothetical protein
VRYAIKDLSYARELAKENGIDARCAELMHQVFEEAVARGDGDRYTPVIRRGMVKGDAEGFGGGPMRPTPPRCRPWPASKGFAVSGLV